MTRRKDYGPPSEDEVVAARRVLDGDPDSKRTRPRVKGALAATAILIGGGASVGGALYAPHFLEQRDQGERNALAPEVADAAHDVAYRVLGENDGGKIVFGRDGSFGLAGYGNDPDDKMRSNIYGRGPGEAVFRLGVDANENGISEKSAVVIYKFDEHGVLHGLAYGDTLPVSALRGEIDGAELDSLTVHRNSDDATVGNWSSVHMGFGEQEGSVFGNSGPKPGDVDVEALLRSVYGILDDTAQS